MDKLELQRHTIQLMEQAKFELDGDIDKIYIAVVMAAGEWYGVQVLRKRIGRPPGSIK